MQLHIRDREATALPPGDGCTVKVKRKRRLVSDWERKQKKKEDA